jgi:hypothetical protein
MLGLATSRLRGLPDFLIIGAQRAGTTSLHKYLMRHAGTARPTRKEIHYFDRYFDLGELWYRSHFPLRSRLRRGDATRVITGEATADYLFHPLVPERARHLVPEARLIVVLRNPVERAYSGWRLMQRTGIDRRPFDEAVRRELEVLTISADQRPSPSIGEYLARGLYATQLERLFRFFPQDRVLLLSSEDLFGRPASVMNVVQDFLGLERRELGPFEPMNSAPGPRLDPVLGAELADFFRPHNERLYELVSRDFRWVERNG